MFKWVSILTFLAWISIDIAYAYTKNRAHNGRVIKWPDGTGDISFVFHGTGASGEQTAFSTAINQWNNAQALNITFSTGAGTPVEGRNDVYFSGSSSIFGGGGVAAITNVTYDLASGEIVEADIIVNENIPFTTTAGSNDYLGDVLGHEVGHALGLAHSEIKHSTMFYWLTRGQYTLGLDDRAGAHALYPDASMSRGKLTGRVAGGQNIGIFGAHVHAISERTGAVVAGGLTESDGRYEIDGVPLNDDYLIYVKPIVAKSTLPEFYSDIRNDFCSSNTSYRGSFFQSCQASKQGFPQAISLTSANPIQETGTVSIRCNLDVPQNYMAEKETLFELDSVDLAGNPGSKMVGYMTADQIASNSPDRLRLDLSSYNTSGANNLYLEFHITYQSLFSIMHLKAQVEKNSVVQTIVDQFNNPRTTIGDVSVTDADNNPNMELIGRVALSSIDPSQNDFELIVIPQSFEDWDTAVASYSSEDFYSRKTQFQDDLTFYLLTYRVVQNVSGNFVHYAGPSNASVSSNLSCLDAPGSYTIVGNVEQSSEVSSPRRAKANDGGFACGSVDMGDGGGGGPGNGFVSFLLGLGLLAVIHRKSERRNNLV